MTKKPDGEAGGNGDGPIFLVPPGEKENASLAKKKAERKKTTALPGVPDGDNGPMFERKPKP
jgi:hypothetical protein